MGLFKKRDASPVAALETELSGLQERQRVLQVRQADATAALSTLHGERRELLLTRDDDTTSIDAACRAGEDRITAIDDALGRLAEQITDAQQRLADEQDKAARGGAQRELLAYT